MSCFRRYVYCSLYHYQCSTTSLKCKAELCCVVVHCILYTVHCIHICIHEGTATKSGLRNPPIKTTFICISCGADQCGFTYRKKQDNYCLEKSSVAWGVHDFRICSDSNSDTTSAMEIANSAANLVSDRKVGFSRNLACALADFSGHNSSRDLHMTYAYRISTMSLCTLHQYQTVSVCYDLTQLHKECQKSTIPSARFFAPCPVPAPAFLLLTCNVVSTLHAYNIVSTRHRAAGALGVEAARSARYAVSVELAAYASTRDIAASGGSCSYMLYGPCHSHGDCGVMFHIRKIYICCV